MTRARLTLAALCCAVAAVASLPTTTSAARSDWFKPYEITYLAKYEACWKAFDSQCGRNVVDDDLANGSKPSQAGVEQRTARMDAWLNPPPAPEPAAPAPATTTTTSTGGYSIPSYIVECESGGDYSAQNPSGAYGAYQIMPGTADAYGCDLSTAEGQDACAAEIYADVGSSAWVCG